LVIYLFIFFITPTPAVLPRLFFLYFLALIIPAIIFWRLMYATLFNILPSQHRILILGDGARAQAIIALLEQHPEINYYLVGHLADEKGNLSTDNGIDVLGTIGELSSVTSLFHIHEIIIAIDRDVDNDILKQVVYCQGQGIKVSLMPDLYEKLKSSIPIEHVDPSWAISVLERMPNRLSLFIKRFIDLTVAVTGILVLLPGLPIIALIIRLDSKGPIFYRQVRCGRGGKPFAICKFRTMVTDAEKDGKAQWASDNDPRITRVGRFLRKTRIDETPQLFNVVRGEMSLVGPRPERPEFVEALEKEIPYYSTRLMMKPGLTGWAQVHYDYGNSVDDALIKLQHDFYYLRYWSLFLDFYTIFRTAGVILRFKGM
ncbi:MAG: sugar transferase, partial [Chloroflexota bacterium]